MGKGEEKRRDGKGVDFSREILILGDFADDFRWGVLKSTMSTSRSRLCSKDLPICQKT